MCDDSVGVDELRERIRDAWARGDVALAELERYKAALRPLIQLVEGGA